MKRFFIIAAAVWGSAFVAQAATLSEGQRSALTQYLQALQKGNYSAAFALLAPADQRYFRNASNYASVFTADRYALKSFRIAGVPATRETSAVAGVDEKISIVDPAHQTVISASTRALYGIVADNGTYRIRDLRHPWKSFAPNAATVKRDGLAVTVRKVSFFRDRIELVVTFANTSGGEVTIFPYGRSVMHDEAQRVYRPLESRLAARMDNELFIGLRLPASAQYTGILGFTLPDTTSTPAKLDLVVAPIVREGADAPSDLTVPQMSVP